MSHPVADCDLVSRFFPLVLQVDLYGRRVSRNLAALVATALFPVALAAGSGAVAAAGASAAAGPQLLAKVNTHGQQPCGSAVLGRYLYVDNYGSGTMARIDPQTNKVTKTIRVGSGPCGVVAGRGLQPLRRGRNRPGWSSSPKQLKVVKKINVNGAPWDVAYGFRSAWTTNFYTGTVSRISGKSKRITKTIRTGGAPTCVRIGLGSVWVGSQKGTKIFRINPKTNSVKRITIGKEGPLSVDVHADGVFVSNLNDASVTKLDPATNSIVGTVTVGKSPADGKRGPDGLEWIPNQGDGTVSLIDPATNEVVNTLQVGGLPFVVRRGFGSMWVDDFKGRTLARYQTG